MGQQDGSYDSDPWRFGYFAEPVTDCQSEQLFIVLEVKTMTIFELAKFFDHSILAPTATDQDLEAGCHYAAEVGTASVCIKPLCRSACETDSSRHRCGYWYRDWFPTWVSLH